MKIEKFENIEAWKESRELVKIIYEITYRHKFSKDFGLKDQIQRSAVSVMTNISEGFDSGTNKSFIQFLNYSYRSASEVQSLLYVAQDIGYINDVDFEKLYSKTSQIKKMVGGFIKYLKSTTTKH